MIWYRFQVHFEIDLLLSPLQPHTFVNESVRLQGRQKELDFKLNLETVPKPTRLPNVLRMENDFVLQNEVFAKKRCDVSADKMIESLHPKKSLELIKIC